MRLTRLELVPYTIPFREPYVTARGRLERRELLLVKLHGEDGLVGLGEAAPLALRGGPDLVKIIRELRESCWPVLRGAQVESVSMVDSLLLVCASKGCSRQALSAVDLALHDLAGKIEGTPVWRLLKATEARPVRCNATLPAGEPEAIVETAREWASSGFDTFKLKVGMPGDVDQVLAVRDAIGSGCRIRVDANGAWSLSDAEEKLAEMASPDLELAEQPVATLEEMAELRGRTTVPLAADESVVNAYDAGRALQLGACEMATVKLAKTGGLQAAATVASALPVYLSSALDGPVGIAGAAHLAQALPSEGPVAGLAHGLATQVLFASTIAAAECRLDGADLVLPDGPGLGVVLDEHALDRHRFDL